MEKILRSIAVCTVKQVLGDLDKKRRDWLGKANFAVETCKFCLRFDGKKANPVTGREGS
jgi:hypothetical protein